MTEVVPVDPDGLFVSSGAWSQATIVGDLVFISGQIAWGQDGRVRAAAIEAQSEVVFDHLERALAACGSGLDRLARICAYLVNRGDVPAFREVRDRRLHGARPASTLVIVEALVDDAALVEIDAVATR